MKTSDQQPFVAETDWKKHMHSLPNPEVPTPAWLRFLIDSAKLAFLFTVGVIAVVVGGGIIGLMSGIGPDHTGGAIYGVLGMILNLSLGFLLFYFNRRSGLSICKCRVHFYTFTAATWIICFAHIGKLGVIHFL